MALWGKADGIYSPGTVTVNYTDKTITGSGTSFTNATVGSVISIGVGITFGEAIISGITSNTFISIASTQFLSGAVISGVAYTMSQKPKYVLHDSNYAESPIGVGTINSVFGVDVFEAQSAISTKQKVSHAGWVGVHTYIDMHGNYRVKSETLVAFSGITSGTSAVGTSYGDAADDVTYPDYLITFTSQPSNVGISTTVTSSFAVVASVAPTATLTYQWQYASGVGAGYTNLANDGFYSNVTTDTLGIAATTNTSKTGWLHRVVVTTNTTDGFASSTSNSATLTYV